jgi:hypothetical protein
MLGWARADRYSSLIIRTWDLIPVEFTTAFADYFNNNRAMARINLAYCLRNPGHYAGYAANFWGFDRERWARWLTASRTNFAG